MDLMYGDYKTIREHMMELSRVVNGPRDHNKFVQCVVALEQERKPGYRRRVLRDGLMFLVQRQNELMGETIA